MEALIKELNQTNLFSGFPEPVLTQQVLPHRQLQEYQKGQFLISPQQRVSRFGIVLAGKVQIMHIFPEGNYSLMTVLTAGDLLGADLICTHSQLSPYYAVAAGTVRVIYLPGDLILKPGKLEEPWRIEALTCLAAWISNENMKKEYRLAILSQKGLRERITTYLTMQAIRRQKTDFSISFSREELAAFLCVNRSALSHELSLMEQEGLLTFRKNHFTLHQRLVSGPEITAFYDLPQSGGR